MASVGFSTGALAYADFERALDLLEDTDADAVELSALRSGELDTLLYALPDLRNRLDKRYKYISFHAPTNFQDERQLVQRLSNVAAIGMNIIVHPDTITDRALWSALGDRLCLENMDSRKPTGRFASELDGFFRALPQAKLCFDIAHARQVDPTMTEAARIVSEFSDRLAQIHLSEVNSNGKHFPMSFAAKRAYEPFASIMSQVPIILESVVSESEIVPEIEATRSLIRSSTRRSSRSEADERAHAVL